MMRERWIWKGVALNGLHLAGSPLLPKKMLVNFDRISKDHCLVHRLRAPISRRHLASFIQGGHRPDVPLVS